MNVFLAIGLAAGYVILVFALRRERRTPLDAFRAVASMRRYGPLRPPLPFVVSAAAAFAGGALGVEGPFEVRFAVGALPALVAWLAWMRIWESHRGLLAAAIVFQDHVPLSERPPKALSPAPAAALSFRPFVAAASLLGAFVVASVALALADRVLHVRGVAFLGAAVFAAIGLTFAAVVKRALDSERAFRLALRAPAEATAEQLHEALRRNPRSPALLEAHADRLVEAGHRTQARLEYEAAMLRAGHGQPLSGKAAALAAALPESAEGPRGAIVRRPDEADPRMLLDPLALPQDAVAVRLLDARELVRDLVALPEEGLLFAVQGRLHGDLLERLEPHEHLSPLVSGLAAIPEGSFHAWRLEPGSREELAAYASEHDVAADWPRFVLFTLDAMLLERRLVRVFVEPGFFEREYPQWRRAAAVGPVEAEVDAGGA